MHEAFKLAIKPIPKFVFVALADNANDEGLCYPAIKTICAKTSLSERTVQNAMLYLEESGYLKREMRDGRSTHYFISDPRTWSTPTPRTTCTPAPDAPTPAPDAPHPRTTCTHPRTTCTQNSNLTIIEPSLNHKPPDWLSVEVWESFVLFRKEKKAPLSDRAITLAFSKLDELRKAGHDPVRVIEESILNGWKGLFAPSVQKTPGSGGSNWWMSNAGIDAKGKELGIHARGGENYESYKARLFEQMKATR